MIDSAKVQNVRAELQMRAPKLTALVAAIPDPFRAEFEAIVVYVESHAYGPLDEIRALLARGGRTLPVAPEPESPPIPAPRSPTPATIKVKSQLTFAERKTERLEAQYELLKACAEGAAAYERTKVAVRKRLRLSDRQLKSFLAVAQNQPAIAYRLAREVTQAKGNLQNLYAELALTFASIRREPVSIDMVCLWIEEERVRGEKRIRAMCDGTKRKMAPTA